MIATTNVTVLLMFFNIFNAFVPKCMLIVNMKLFENYNFFLVCTMFVVHGNLR